MRVLGLRVSLVKGRKLYNPLMHRTRVLDGEMLSNIILQVARGLFGWAGVTAERINGSFILCGLVHNGGRKFTPLALLADNPQEEPMTLREIAQTTVPSSDYPNYLASIWYDYYMRRQD